MKILLIGEFSGLHSELKKGLIRNGHEVTILASGDGWKKLETDYIIPTGLNKLKKILSIFKQYILLKKFKNYDIVQFIFPQIFNRYVNEYFINILINNNKKVFLIAAGSDYYYWKNYDKKFRYYPHEDNITFDGAKSWLIQENKWFENWNKKMANKVEAIIPVAYDYKIGYEDFKNTSKSIPLPLDYSSLEYNKNKYYDIERRKIKILYGISRHGFKGSKYILPALNKIKINYKDKIEIFLPEKLPYIEYIDLLRDVDIVVDQCLTYSYGMNAILSAAFGNVTLTGAEKECLLELNELEIPFINILPSEKDIYNKIEELILDRRKIIDIGQKSRNYVINKHCAKKVSIQYIEEWFNSDR